MAGAVAVSGEEFQAFGVGLAEQQFVEWIAVGDCNGQGCGGVGGGQWQEVDVLVAEDLQGLAGIERAFAVAGGVKGGPFQAHFPD